MVSRRAVLPLLPLLLLAVLLLAGCGGTRTVTAPPLTHQQTRCVPKEGEGVMGRCTPHAPALGFSKPLFLSGGGVIPDVSEFQNEPDWVAARAHIVAAIVRVQDNLYFDRKLGYNVAALTRLKIPYAAYAFLRPGNCAGQADLAASRLASYGARHIILIGDGEVPLNAGCIGQFAAEAERVEGRISVDYSSSGPYPGGARPGDMEWDAAYGGAPGCFLCNGRRVAWQHTDGVIGAFPRSTPGIGAGDVSRDEGLAALIGHSTAVVSKSEKRTRLGRHYRARQRIRMALDQHHCRPRSGWHGHASPRSWHTQCGRELAAGQRENQVIANYHREGVY